MAILAYLAFKGLVFLAVYLGFQIYSFVRYKK